MTLRPSLLSLFPVLFLLLACGSRHDECAPGSVSHCGCANAATGTELCTSDGHRGACLCAGDVHGVPPVIPIPLPPAPPLVPMPPARVLAGTPAERIAAWVHGPLRGRDNGMAHLRAVTITDHAGTYDVTIANQFRFHCGLAFDADGLPTTLRQCRSPEPHWAASPTVIHLSCEVRPDQELCRGLYYLLSTHFHEAATMELIRPRAPARP